MTPLLTNEALHHCLEPTSVDRFPSVVRAVRFATLNAAGNQSDEHRAKGWLPVLGGREDLAEADRRYAARRHGRAAAGLPTGSRW